MHEAKKTLLDSNTPNTLDIVYKGKRRTLVYHQCNGTITIKYPGSQNKSLIFKDWDNITKIYDPRFLNEEEKRQIEEKKERKLTLKYIEAANNSDFENVFVRKCLEADMKKSPKKNGLSTGCKIEGELITIGTIRKSAPEILDQFQTAFNQKRMYESDPFKFQNYTCVLSVEIDRSGMPHGVFVKKLVRFSGYYRYYLINRATFIGHSIGE